MAHMNESWLRVCPFLSRPRAPLRFPSRSLSLQLHVGTSTRLFCCMFLFFALFRCFSLSPTCMHARALNLLPARSPSLALLCLAYTTHRLLFVFSLSLPSHPPLALTRSLFFISLSRSLSYSLSFPRTGMCARFVSLALSLSHTFSPHLLTSCIRSAWLYDSIRTCEMTHSCVWHDSIHVLRCRLHQIWIPICSGVQTLGSSKCRCRLFC